jgi:hypothetical protein
MIVNERFIKLALDAGLLNYVDHETPRRYFVHGHAEQEEVEKFAELIIQECISICEDMDGVDNFEQMMHPRTPRYDCAIEIREHFGVEE